MLRAFSNKSPAPTKIWRGVIVTIICAAYLLIIFDYSQPPDRNDRLYFFVALFGGISGMLVYFFDFYKWYRSNQSIEESELGDNGTR